MKHPILSSALAVLAFAAAAAVPLAQAQTASPPRKVSRDELRACLDADDSLKTRRKALEERAAQIKAEQDTLKAESEELAQERERLEKSPNQLRGDRLDRRTAALQRKIDAAKANAAKFTPEAETLNSDLTGYNQRCGGITYSREDRDAILKERGAAKQ